MSEVESINPNVPVTSNLTKEGTIEADATGGPLSFDELEEVTKAEKKAKAEKAEPKQEKSKDLTSDTDKGKKAEPKETKESKPKEPKESAEETKAAEVIEKQIKKIKAKYAENEYELEEDSLIPVKINGKEEMVALKDILGNYSGKVAWDKKFSELDSFRKTNAAQELKLRQVADMIKDAYEEADPNMRLYRMASLAGIDPVEFRNKFYNENLQTLEKYYSMSEDERKADALAYEANIHKHRADTLEKRIREEQDYKSLQDKVHQLRERHQVSEREFVQKFDELDAQFRLKNIDPKNLTPETIMKAIEYDRLFSSAAQKLESLDLGWSNEEKMQRLQKLVLEADKIGLTAKDMPDMIDELWGVKKARNKIEEKKKQNEEFLSGKKPVSQAKVQTNSPVFFDEM